MQGSHHPLHANIQHQPVMQNNYQVNHPTHYTHYDYGTNAGSLEYARGIHPSQQVPPFQNMGQYTNAVAMPYNNPHFNYQNERAHMNNHTSDAGSGSNTK